MAGIRTGLGPGDEARAPRALVLWARDRDGLFSGIRVGRDAVLEEILARLFHLDVPCQRGDDRLVDALRAVLLHYLGDHLGEYHRRRDDRVPVAEDQRVDALIFQSESDRVAVCGRRLATGDVDRVACRAEGRDELAERA